MGAVNCEMHILPQFPGVSEACEYKLEALQVGSSVLVSLDEIGVCEILYGSSRSEGRLDAHKHTAFF